MPVEIYIDECHKQGMEFIAGFRMNDRHGHHPEFFKKLCEEKPEWVLREYKPSTRKAPPESREYGCSVNYAIPEVREWLLSIMEKVANRFDIDGIEFNFSRLAECFPKDELATSHSIMTDFIRQVRHMLDIAGKRKGRDLMFGVRVHQQLDGCLAMSLDVPAWITEGLINYVAPGDFGFIDFNETYEDFTSIAREHNCFVYPQTQPRLSIDTEHIMTPAQYRAALQNFYGAGADGFSTQNFFFNWGPKFDIPGDSGAEIPAQYPIALNQLKELKDPETVANSRDRHYTFIPLWANSKGLGQCYKREEIKLSRNEIGQRKTFRFRICENLPPEPILPLTDEGSFLTFFVQGLLEGDEITVDINSTKISSEHLKWTWSGDGLPSYTIAVSTPPFVYGDNHLGLQLTKTTERVEGDITVERVECRIQSLPQ